MPNSPSDTSSVEPCRTRRADRQARRSGRWGAGPVTLALVAAGMAATGLVSVVTPQARSGERDDRAIVHLLNRVAFGPRPGDVDRVARMGIHAYIDAQLRPERVSDAAMSARLSTLPTLTMSSRQIAERFERPLLDARRQAKQQEDRQATGDDGTLSRPDARLRQEANAPLAELASQKVLRAAYSERQLQEVLTDFWFNHFNVDARKGPVRFLLTEYERDAIRPHVLGRFRELLGATAKSPAMLFYLDNWMNAADTDGSERRTSARRRLGRRRSGSDREPRQSGMPRGLNENYGRELLELHTLGVDGGYTQKDVTEVARAFTGWTIVGPRRGGGFRFVPSMHAVGEKLVLGQTIKTGGIDAGEQVLDILARHPSTARHIAAKLARRFVADEPPSSLVARAAERFRVTNGDLREVVRTILTSPEFDAPDAYRAKTKTPLEFLVSAVRATGVELHDARLLVRQAHELGMPLYQCQPPTGYHDTGEAWTNTGALVARMNAALTLARGPGSAPRDETIRTVVSEILAGDLSPATLTTIARASEPAERLALVLGSPEFQKR